MPDAELQCQTMVKVSSFQELATVQPGGDSASSERLIAATASAREALSVD
jgi:hypothetical protein